MERSEGIRWARAWAWACVCVALVLGLAAGCSGGTGGGTDTGADTATDTGDPGDVHADDVEGDGGDGGGDTAVADTADGTDAAELVSSCSPACGDHAACVDGACVCDAGWGDCDGEAATGCEEGLSTPAHCGACEPGLGCGLFGIDAICTVEAPGTAGFCAPTCLPGYVDLDGDTATDVRTTGCETGFETRARADLSATLPAALVDLALDGTTLYGVLEDTTVKLVGIDVSGAAPAAGPVVDTTLAAGSKVAVAASGGVVVVPVLDGLLVVYEVVDGALVRARDVSWNGVVDVVAVEPPRTTGAVAEFVAVGAGLRWYGVYPQGSTPAGATCLNGDAPTTVAICVLGETRTQESFTVAAFGRLGGADWGAAAGSTTVAFQLEPTLPAIVSTAVTGDWVDSAVTALGFADGNRLLAVEAARVATYEFTLGATSQPEEIARTEIVADLGAVGSSVAALDSDRVAVGSSAALHVVRLSTGDAAPHPDLGAVSALLLDDGVLYAAESTTLWVLGLDLGPL